MKNSTAGFNKQSGTEATPTTDSKPEGQLQKHTFSGTFVKLAPGRAVFLVVQTRDIPRRYPLGDRSQRALHLLAPAMRQFTVSGAINPLCGCVVLSKNSTSGSSSCTAMSSFKFLRAVAAGTVGFQKIEPVQDGYGLFDDLASRRLIFESLLFEHLLVLHVVTVGEDAVTSFRRMKAFSDLVHFHPIRCRQHALHSRLAMDPYHLLTLFAIALSLWASYCCSPENSVVAASTGHLCACV
ncbi:hypothetical protein MTO96_013879 [Rhipicephalus appendiculatus]